MEKTYDAKLNIKRTAIKINPLFQIRLDFRPILKMLFESNIFLLLKLWAGVKKLKNNLLDWCMH